MRRLLVVCAVAVVAGAVVSLAMGASGGAPPGRWVIRDLGATGRTASAAVDVNERGDVAGSVATAIPGESPSRHAVLWSKGKMRDLGTLPLGGRLDMPNSSEAIAINDRGLIIGTSQVERMGPDPLAFLWRNGSMNALGCGSIAPPLCDVSSRATALSERGQVIGWISTTSDRGTRFGYRKGVAFSWENGRLIRLGTLPGRMYSFARDVNEDGVVVGSSYSLGGEGEQVGTRAFRWSKGTMTDLGALPGETASEAVAINDRGQILAISDVHAFLWQNGKLTELGALPGDRVSEPVAINNRGQVIGNSSKAILGQRHAFLWQAGRMTRLGTLSGDTASEAVAINDRGQIVGVSEGNARRTAFVWQNGKMTALPRPPRGGMAAPTAINVRGQIVGWAETRAGQSHAVLWTWNPAGR